MSTLDRYLIRLAIPPFLAALGVFTFVLAVTPLLDRARDLLAKGVAIGTVAQLLGLLLPSAFAITIPMAFLTGLLMALGRLSGDRESVALLACGVSPLRLLRPVLLLGLVVAALDMWTLMRLTPDWNQAYRDIAFKVLTEQSSAEIRPRVFFERLPNRAIYVRDSKPGGAWSGVFAADTSEPNRPKVTTAATGSLIIDRPLQLVRLNFFNAFQYVPGKEDARLYVVGELADVSIDIKAEHVFNNSSLTPGIREKDAAALRRDIAEHRRNGISPHAEIIQLHQMYSFPVACLILALAGLALGLNTRKEGRLAGLTLGLGVIVVYYALMALAEAQTKGLARGGANADVAAAWARWVPNIGVGILAVLLLWRQTRPNGLNLPVPAWMSSRRRRPVPESQLPRPIVHFRMPGLGLPFLPRLLDRYLSGRYLRIALLTSVSFLLLYYIGAFVELADKLFKGQATLALFGRFLLQSTPQFIAFLIPFAILLAVLGTIGGLTRSGELIVMRACGVSLYRAAMPFFLFALVGSAALFYLEDRVLAKSNQAAEALRNTIRGIESGPELGPTQQNWLVSEDNRFYHYAYFEPAHPINGNRPAVHGLSVFGTATEPFRLTDHLFAAIARYDGQQWHLQNGWEQRFDTPEASARVEFAERTLRLLPLEDFRRAQVDPATLPFADSLRYIRKLAANGMNMSEQLVGLHRKVAFPLVTLVMTLLAIPFGVTIGKKGALYGVGLAIILAAGYFLLMTFFTAVGAAGLVPPVLAAWGANIIFLAGAVILTLTVRT